MAYLLDTCVISEIRRSNRNGGVSAWITGVPAGELFLSVLTLGEIRRGIELRRLYDTATASKLERWLSGIEVHFGDRILSITAAIADHWGRLSLTQPLPITDGLIAATALEHKLTIVTRNVPDFQRSGASTLNPFS